MTITVPGVIVDGTAPVTATPARSDVVVYQGVDTTFVVPVTGSNGSAATLTGGTGVLTIIDRVLPATGKPVTKLTYPATVGASTLTFQVPGADLKALMLVGFWWDVMFTSLAGKVDEVVPSGLLTVNFAAGA